MLLVWLFNVGCVVLHGDSSMDCDRSLFTREALLSEAGFEKVFRTQNWVRRSKLFCDDFVPCWGKRGAYPLLLEPGGS